MPDISSTFNDNYRQSDIWNKPVAICVEERARGFRIWTLDKSRWKDEMDPQVRRGKVYVM